MEFLVKLTPHLPDTLNEEEFNDLLNCERTRGAGLMKKNGSVVAIIRYIVSSYALGRYRTR